MKSNFLPNGLPLLIGSLPLRNHGDAIDLVFTYTPEIPLWIQLPAYAEEGMIYQFLSGLPGLVVNEDSYFIDTSDSYFSDQMVKFYEEYLAVSEGKMDFSDSKFVLKPDTTKGFYYLIERLKILTQKPVAIKGQITGPVTFATSVKDQEGKAIFYDPQLRDAAVKLLAMKAVWQVRQLRQYGNPVIIFFDEPGLAGFGSSEFISISKDDVITCFEEVIEAVHLEGGLVGIHVCANADWSIILQSGADIVNFDAYSYSDRFFLYSDIIRDFLNAGKMIAWGIVPTFHPEDIEKETSDSLVKGWYERVEILEKLNFSRSEILAKSFITPSCGLGSLTLSQATKVLQLTRETSDKLRGEIL